MPRPTQPPWPNSLPPKSPQPPQPPHPQHSQHSRHPRHSQHSQHTQHSSPAPNSPSSPQSHSPKLRDPSTSPTTSTACLDVCGSMPTGPCAALQLGAFALRRGTWRRRCHRCHHQAQALGAPARPRRPQAPGLGSGTAQPCRPCRRHVACRRCGSKADPVARRATLCLFKTLR